jgi:hypothetical protein
MPVEIALGQLLDDLYGSDLAHPTPPVAVNACAEPLIGVLPRQPGNAFQHLLKKHTLLIPNPALG